MQVFSLIKENLDEILCKRVQDRLQISKQFSDIFSHNTHCHFGIKSGISDFSFGCHPHFFPPFLRRKIALNDYRHAEILLAPNFPPRTRFLQNLPILTVNLRKSFNQELGFKLQSLPLEDVIFLHNLFLEIEDLHWDLGGTKAWEEFRQVLSLHIPKLREMSFSGSESLPELIKTIRNMVSKCFLGNRFTSHEHPDFDKRLSNASYQKPFTTESSVEYSVESHAKFPAEFSSTSIEKFDAFEDKNRILIPAKKYYDYVSRICELFQTFLRPNETQEVFGIDSAQIRKYDDDIHNFDKNNAVETQPVYFITNRKIDDRFEHRGEYYGTENGKALRYGFSEISCAKGKPQIRKENQYSVSMDDATFINKLRKDVEESENKSLLLYIHGCFTDFGRALGYGAQISSGLNFKGPMVVFSWPTNGRPSLSSGLNVIHMYRKDEVSSIQSAQFLKEAIEKLCTEAGAKSIHVIGYSMGSKTLLYSLDLLKSGDLLKDQDQNQGKDEVFIQNRNQDEVKDQNFTSHFYFMAPDVTAKSFSKITREFKFPSVDVNNSNTGSKETSRFSEPEAVVLNENQAALNKKQGEESNSGSQFQGKPSQSNFMCVNSVSEKSSLDSANDVHNLRILASVPGKLVHQDSHWCNPASMPESSSALSNIAKTSETRDNNGAQCMLVKTEIELEKPELTIEKPHSEGFVSVMEKLADSSTGIFEDIFSSLQTVRQVWKEGRRLGWAEFLQKIFGPDESQTDEKRRNLLCLERSNAHIHLYAAKNDIALLLSELIMDVGTPEIRAGRRTTEFLLCGNTFDTIDASLLQSGFFTTGHFYIFHKIVRADMKNLIEQGVKLPWWRKMEKWQKYDYFQLHSRPQASASEPDSDFFESHAAATFEASPLIWACP